MSIGWVIGVLCVLHNSGFNDLGGLLAVMSCYFVPRYNWVGFFWEVVQPICAHG